MKWQANCLASAILMPKSMVTRTISELDYKTRQRPGYMLKYAAVPKRNGATPLASSATIGSDT